MLRHLSTRLTVAAAGSLDRVRAIETLLVLNPNNAVSRSPSLKEGGAENIASLRVIVGANQRNPTNVGGLELEVTVFHHPVGSDVVGFESDGVARLGDRGKSFQFNGSLGIVLYGDVNEVTHLFSGLRLAACRETGVSIPLHWGTPALL